MSSVDRVLKAIDSGLQSSGESGYSTDHSPDLCSRCQRNEPVVDGDLCLGCRAFLLGDSDEDPLSPVVHSSVAFGVDVAAATAAMRQFQEALLEALRPVVQAFQELAPPAQEALREHRLLIDAIHADEQWIPDEQWEACVDDSADAQRYYLNRWTS